jgi:hypothetical protein
MGLERQPQEGLPSIGCRRSADTLVATRKKSWRLDGHKRDRQRDWLGVSKTHSISSPRLVRPAVVADAVGLAPVKDSELEDRCAGVRGRVPCSGMPCARRLSCGGYSWPRSGVGQLLLTRDDPRQVRGPAGGRAGRRRRVGERSRAGTLSAWAREARLNETAEVVRRTRNGWLAGIEQQEAQTARSPPLRDHAEQWVFSLRRGGGGRLLLLLLAGIAWLVLQRR